MNFEKDCSLIIIDLQNDFCPGGSLAVNEGNKIINKINSLQTKFSSIVLTQDWHPLDHLSFASNQNNKIPYETVEMSYGVQVLWPQNLNSIRHFNCFIGDFIILIRSKRQVVQWMPVLS